MGYQKDSRLFAFDEECDQGVDQRLVVDPEGERVVSGIATSDHQATDIQADQRRIIQALNAHPHEALMFR